MKLLGLSCGRKMGNSEILLKEALMGAEEYGVEVELLRMLDLDIRPCKLCKRCHAAQNGFDACVIKDDASFFYNKFMDCDGIIFSVPIYSTTPPGYLKLIGDRVLGIHVDFTALRTQKKGDMDIPFMSEELKADERALKSRVGAFITTGGASSPNWLAFGLPLLYTVTFSADIQIVDHLEVIKAQPIPQIGMIVLNDAALERGRKLGRNVGEAMKKKRDEVEWKGDAFGTCPVCHLDLIKVIGGNVVECPVCGISGTLRIEKGEIRVNFSDEQQKHSRLKDQGKLDHQIEIHKIMLEQSARAHEVPDKVKKYQSYLVPLTPPSQQK